MAVIKSFCHLHSSMVIDAICDALQHACLIFQQRLSIVLLCFLRKSFNCLDHNSARFLCRFWANIFPFSDPLKAFWWRENIPRRWMNHPFSMWPTLRNTIYLPEITSLGHSHTDTSFPAHTQSHRFMYCLYFLHVRHHMMSENSFCYRSPPRDCVRDTRISRGDFPGSLSVSVTKKFFPFWVLSILAVIFQRFV